MGTFYFKSTTKFYCTLFILLFFLLGCEPSDNSLGLFSNSSNIGDVGIDGTVLYDKNSDTYFLSGSGENMWFDQDAFNFLWKNDSGNVSLTTNLNWIGEGSHPHRKAGVIIRTSLDPGSPYADVVVHGDGLTSLQYREDFSEDTKEVQANMKNPKRIKIEKVGKYVHII